MKSLLRLCFLPLFLLSILLFTHCGEEDYPVFRRMENVQFKSIGFAGGLSVALQGNAIFFNPNPVGANVTEVNLDLYINGKKVTKVKQEVSAQMKPRSEFSLPLAFDVPLKEVFKDAKPTLGDIFKKRKIEYKFLGNIKVGLGNVEFAVPVEYADEDEIRF